MGDAFEREEVALRRRLLFRLLRGHRFDRPDFGTETISELVPKGMIAPGSNLFAGARPAGPAKDGPLP